MVVAVSNLKFATQWVANWERNAIRLSCRFRRCILALIISFHIATLCDMVSCFRQFLQQQGNPLGHFGRKCL